MKEYNIKINQIMVIINLNHNQNNINDEIKMNDL